MNNSVYQTNRNAYFTGRNIGPYSGKAIWCRIEENDFLVNGGIIHHTRYVFFAGGVRRIGDVLIIEDEKDHVVKKEYGYGRTLLNQFQLIK